MICAGACGFCCYFGVWEGSYDKPGMNPSPCAFGLRFPFGELTRFAASSSFLFSNVLPFVFWIHSVRNPRCDPPNSPKLSSVRKDPRPFLDPHAAQICLSRQLAELCGFRSEHRAPFVPLEPSVFAPPAFMGCAELSPPCGPLLAFLLLPRPRVDFSSYVADLSASVFLRSDG